jgi:splicing factor 3B subunit 3
MFFFLMSRCFIQEMKEAAGEEERELAEEMSKAFMSEELPEDVFGAPKAGSGMWASVIRIISPAKANTVFQVALEQNEAAHRLDSNQPAYENQMLF